jgi:hypothetical protein
MPESCSDRARIAAAVIAAWQGEPSASLLEPPVPPPVAVPPPHPVAIAAPLPEPAMVATHHSHASGVALEINAAFVGAFANTAFAPGATAEARLAPAPLKLGFTLGLLGESTRTFSLGEGRASWGRSAARVGIGYRFSPGRWRLDLRAETMAALLYLNGAGFDRNYQRFAVDVGLSVGARIGIQLGWTRPFVGIDAIGWLRPEQAAAEHGTTVVNADVPRFEVLLNVGVAVGHGPSRARP